jgi:signal transduction histidine kinase
MRDRYIAFPSAFDVWPASAADVVVVKAVPWWTRGEVVAALRWLLAGFALVAVAATTLVILLRRTVRRQVALLEQKRQNEAVLEERQRIAREVHDSLEQDLAGLALRLDATASTAADDRLRGHEHARGGDRPRRRGQRPVGCGPG